MALESEVEILDSWKQIAQYLNREVRTCYRWSRSLGLPVHRIDDKSPKSKVFAYKDEIDKWLKDKAQNRVLSKNGPRAKRRLIYGGVSFFAILSILAIARWPPFAPNGRMISVVVAPLKSVDPSGNDEYLSEQIARAVAENLSVPNKLRVIPAFSIRRPVNGFADVEKLGDELGADYILRGEVRKGNPEIQVSVELIGTENGSIIWRSPFLELAERALSIPPSICTAVHKVLKIGNGTLAGNTVYAKDYRALDSYLKGDFILSRLNAGSDDPWRFCHQGEYYAGRFTPEANELAIKLFAQAIKIEPTFAQAYIGLASCYANYVNFSWQSDISWLKKAEELLAKAQALSPDLPEYYSTLIEIKILEETGFSENTWTSVKQLVTEGIKKCGNHPQLTSIVGYYFYKKFGREGDAADFQRALEYKERSFWLNPLGLANIVYANLLMLNQDFGKALEVCDVLQKVDETHMSEFLVGEILYYMGDLDGSSSAFEQLVDVSLEYKISSLYYQAMIFARKGDFSAARKAIAEAAIISPETFVHYEKDLKLASVFAGLGEKELAYKALESFLGHPARRKDSHIYKKYVDLDDNFFRMKDDHAFKKIFNHGEETDGKKQDDSGHA